VLRHPGAVFDLLNPAHLGAWMEVVADNTPLNLQGNTQICDVPYYPTRFASRNLGHPQGPPADK